MIKLFASALRNCVSPVLRRLYAWEIKESDPHGTTLSPDSARAILTQGVCGLDVAQRNPGIGVMDKRSPVFRCATYGLRVAAFMMRVPGVSAKTLKVARRAQ